MNGRKYKPSVGSANITTKKGRFLHKLHNGNNRFGDSAGGARRRSGHGGWFLLPTTRAGHRMAFAWPQGPKLPQTTTTTTTISGSENDRKSTISSEKRASQLSYGMAPKTYEKTTKKQKKHGFSRDDCPVYLIGFSKRGRFGRELER